VKTIDIFEAYIKFGTKLFHLALKKKVKCKIGHGKSEEKGEFGSPWTGFKGLKGRTLIMLGPNCL
jgi:hypothetical protein